MSEDKNNTWLADVVLAFRKMEDGRAWLQDIYDWIKLNRRNYPPNFTSAIRATVYAYSTDAAAYVPGNPDLFHNVARGIWALRFPNEVAPKKSDDLRLFAFSQLTKSELECFSGKGPELLEELNRRAELVRQKYHLPVVNS